jgi:xanthine dehydrogenase accessory factor
MRDVTDESAYRRAAELSDQGRAYVIATVVARRAPSSSRVGQKAIIESDGGFHGWLGGSCVEPVVRKEAREALLDGRPRLIVLAPDARSDRPDAIVYPMTCHSGGTVEIYLEPQLPPSLLLLYGESPVSHALAAMGEQAGYRVRLLDEPDSRETLGADMGDEARLYAVVATLGEWDMEAIEDALRAGSHYVGLIASPRRSEEMRRLLLAREWDEDELTPLVGPAGLDIGAREPAEIAISILAELIQHRAEYARRRDERNVAAAEGSPSTGKISDGNGPEGSGARAPTVALDPICGMEVQIDGARHTLEHRNATYYFCCSGCREKFERDQALAVDS